MNFTKQNFNRKGGIMKGNNRYEKNEQSPQGSGHVDVQWQVCRAVACAAGQDRHVRRRIRRKTRIRKGDVLQLGNRICNSVLRQTARNCEGVRYISANFDTERIDFCSNLEKSEKFSNFSALEIPVPNGKLERILEKIRFLRI
jgi:hypothetical protein